MHIIVLLLLLPQLIFGDGRPSGQDPQDEDLDMTETPPTTSTKLTITSATIPSISSFPALLPTLRNMVGPFPETTRLIPPAITASDQIGFPPLVPLWTPPPLLTFPTLPPFTLPTPPPPSAPINITIDPEALMDVPEIISHWGYPVETHKVVTTDGYILTLHRIPHDETSKSAMKKQKPVIFLQHGLLCTSSIWLLNLPHQSAGFIFADHGYDVWFGNMRGNTYSKQHLRMNNGDPQFWKFSWEEMSRHDLPAMIDYVVKTTKHSQVYYVGHSQGSLTMFAKMSQDDEFSSKIRQVFAMAPVARMSHIKGLFHDLGEVYDQYKMIYQVFGDGEFLTNNIFTKLLTDIMCDQSVQNPLCENFIFAVSGPNSNQFNMSRIGIYLAHNPAGTSSRNMLHFAQMVHSKRMERFDLGPENNLRFYKSAVPPEYDLRRINSSIHLFYSDSDWLAGSKDVEGFLIPMLKKTTLKSATKLKDFNHNDFLWGMRARKEIYEKITEFIDMDYRKLKMQDGIRKYFASRPGNLPTTLSEELIKQLRNVTMDLD
ncbi:unnamed protein product [Caenorhabditis bovis]|uniref:Partial AB-hydrolase lipase domain-containing protein n=1 Tax=Caenorhabditis bovis TaxID=2654633 RepID=A0A8S1EH64_9PELO|nr:unnamed protein product [Caenorhabditis bovis]